MGNTKKISALEFKKVKKKRKELKLLKKLSEGEKSVKKDTVEFSSVKALKTLSIAVPGSIILNAQTDHLQSYLAGQISRAATIFNVDEVVVFDDMGCAPVDGGVPLDFKKWNACLKLGRILQYLECPQYLRKDLFPIHSHLAEAGVVNPIEAPHHYRADECPQFREGVVTSKPQKSNKGSYVNVGLKRDILVDRLLSAGVRVTVKISDYNQKKLRGIVVPPSMPKAELGIYWGYSVRLAKSLSQVITECPYDGGYDLTLGTSDKGSPVADLDPPPFSHCLVVFGGVDGLETALEADSNLKIDSVSDLFDHYINTCPNQGSRTIRTEEAVLISLSQLTSRLFIDVISTGDKITDLCVS